MAKSRAPSATNEHELTRRASSSGASPRAQRSALAALEGLRDPRAHRRQGDRRRGRGNADQALGPHRGRQRRARVVPAAVAAQRHRCAPANNAQFACHRPARPRWSPAPTGRSRSARDAVREPAPATRQMTAFMAGTNETHTTTPTVDRATAQRQLDLRDRRVRCRARNPTVIPVIAVGDVAVRHRAGRAARRARRRRRRHRRPVQQRGVARRRPARERRATPTLYRAHYDALARLNRAADRSTTKRGLRDRQQAPRVPRHEPRRRSSRSAGGPRRATASTARPATNVAEIGRSAHRRGQGVQARPDHVGRDARPCATIRTARSTTWPDLTPPWPASARISTPSWPTSTARRTTRCTGTSWPTTS